MTILKNTGEGAQQYRWDDSQAPAFALPTGGTAPTFVAIRGANVFGYRFDGNDLCHGTIQLPHMLVPDPVVHFHVHFTFDQDTALNNTVGFRLDYTWAAPGGTFTVEANTGTVTHTCGGNERYTHQIKELEDITLTGATFSTILAFRLQKLDGTTGVDPVILSIDAHFQKGAFGTVNEYS
jgi:hypothetical protein